MEHGAYSRRDNIALLICMTVMFVLAILSLTSFVRQDLKADAKEAVSVRSLTIDSAKFNEQELEILCMLEGMPQLVNSSGKKTSRWTMQHIRLLAEYFEKEDIRLDKVQLNKLGRYIQGSHEILRFELNRDIGKLSVDSRNMIMLLYKNIYSLLGLDLSYGIDNNIESIYEENGRLVYQIAAKEDRLTINREALVITLILLCGLAGLYIVIVRRSQLNLKDGEYHGYDEKEYA